MSGEAGEEEEETPQYPIMMRRSWRAFVAPAALGLVSITTATLVVSTAHDQREWIIVAVLALGFGEWLLNLIEWRRIVAADRIEARTLIGTRSLARAQLLGVGMRPGHRSAPPQLVVVAADGGTQITLPDRALIRRTWIGSLPSVGLSNGRVSPDPLLDNPALGPTLDVRRSRIGMIRIVSLVLTAIGLIAPALAYFGAGAPPTVVSVAAAAPILALVLAAGLSLVRGPASHTGAGAPLPRRSLVRPAITLLLAGVGFALELAALHLVDPWTLAPLGAVIGLPLAAWAIWLDRSYVFEDEAPLAAGVLVAGIVWAAGGIGAINQASDSGATRVHATQVVDTHVYRGRGLPTYDVDVRAWDGSGRTVSYDVTDDVYRALDQGRLACIRLHPGGLGFAWYEVQACTPSPRPAR